MRQRQKKNISRSALLQIIHLKIMIFWDLMPWSMVEGYQHFTALNLHFQCGRFYYKERGSLFLHMLKILVCIHLLQLLILYLTCFSVC